MKPYVDCIVSFIKSRGKPAYLNEIEDHIANLVIKSSSMLRREILIALNSGPFIMRDNKWELTEDHLFLSIDARLDESDPLIINYFEMIKSFLKKKGKAKALTIIEHIRDVYSLPYNDDSVSRHVMATLYSNDNVFKRFGMKWSLQ